MLTAILQDPVREYSASAALTSVRTAHSTVLNDSTQCLKADLGCRVRRAHRERQIYSDKICFLACRQPEGRSAGKHVVNARK